MRRLCGHIVCPRCVVATARRNTCRCCAARARTPSGAGQLPVSPPVHVRDRAVGASKAGGAPHLVSQLVAVPKTPPKAPPATAGRLPLAEGAPVEEPEPTPRPRLAPTPKVSWGRFADSRAPWLVKTGRGAARTAGPGPGTGAAAAEGGPAAGVAEESPPGLPLPGRPGGVLAPQKRRASRSPARLDAGSARRRGC